MSHLKYDAPVGAPPSYTPSESTINSPAPAHVQPAQDPSYPYNQNQLRQDYPPPAGYGQHPQMGNAQQNNGYPPQQGYYGQPQGPYGPQGGYPQQGPYGPGPNGPQGGYRPQGQYVDDRRGGPGVMEGLLGALACCCCLDCLLF